MPMYNLLCEFCGHIVKDRMEKIAATVEDRGPCPKCSAVALVRTWVMGEAHSAHGDEIDIYVRHGVVNEDGSPKRFRSKRELFREAKARGLANNVEHIGRAGGDKNSHTVRWVSAPVISEEERVRHWHEDEERLQKELAAQSAKEQ